MIEVKEIRDNPKEILEFPCLMKHKLSGDIILVCINKVDTDSAYCTGVFLTGSLKGKFSLAHFKDDFKIYGGTLEISNG